jgi:hypothetical protein
LTTNKAVRGRLSGLLSVAEIPKDQVSVKICEHGGKAKKTVSEKQTVPELMSAGSKNVVPQISFKWKQQFLLSLPCKERNDMPKLPTVVASSVIRSTQKGDSHGGLYLIDLEEEKTKQVVDWDDYDIDWEGRGAGRGLRGIAFYKDMLISTSSTKIHYYDKGFNIIKSFGNKYLCSCHEIYRHEDKLYLSSTSYDSILVFDLEKEKFTKAYCFRRRKLFTYPKLLQRIIYKIRLIFKLPLHRYRFFSFNPNRPFGPKEWDSYHLNNVFVHQGQIHFSCLWDTSLYKINENEQAEKVCEIPKGTHNVSIINERVVMNDTGNDRLKVIEGKDSYTISIPRYDDKDINHNGLPNDHARSSFGRGLCAWGDYLIGGSSPATITVYNLKTKHLLKKIQISNDVRNAIHGLEVYP